MDWEFREDGRTIEPISVALVAATGDEYHAVNANMSMAQICSDPWLLQNVVPHLPLTSASDADGTPVLDLRHPSVKPLSLIKSEVRGFILSYPKPQLWGWYSDFDLVVLTWLFGRMVDMPREMPHRVNDVQQEADRLGIPESEFPAQVGPEHDVLSDARHIRWLHDFLIDAEARQHSRPGRTVWVSE